MYNTVKTIWHIRLEAFRSSKQPFTTDQYSTLNEHFQIQAGATIPAGRYPDVAYLAIGRGGHKNVTGAGGESLTDPQQLPVKAARLMEHLPFIIRPITNDLSATERAKYRLRREETIGGQRYFCYYLRKIELSNQPPVIEQVTITNGVAVRTPYTSSADQLNPVPVTVVNGKVNTSTGTHLAVSTPIQVVLTKQDIAEIVAAAEIKYKDSRYAVISELALVSAIDDTVTSNAGGISTTYTEAIAAQCCNFIGSNTQLLYQSERAEFNFRMSGSVPLVI